MTPVFWSEINGWILVILGDDDTGSCKLLVHYSLDALYTPPLWDLFCEDHDALEFYTILDFIE